MNGTVIDRPFLDLRDRLVNLSPAYDERGLLSIAFHPGYATNGRVFAYYSAPLRAGADPAWSCTNRLSEFHVSASDPNQVDLSSEKVLLEVDKPYQNHNGGTLLFGPDDGYLYLPLGDGGRADDTGIGHTPGTGNGQDMTKLLGKVIRIDVDHAGAGLQYAIPADNPFVADHAARPEIFAYGFRNPAYASFDSGGSHRMFIAMAGQRLFESVFIVYRGGAYPWNIREGTHCFDPANDGQPKAGPCPVTSACRPAADRPGDRARPRYREHGRRGCPLPGQPPSVAPGRVRVRDLVGLLQRHGERDAARIRTPAVPGPSSLPADAAALTPSQNAMWTTREIRVANNGNGRINAFVRGLFENDDHEVLVLVNRNGGPGGASPGTGEIWEMVPAGASGPVSATATTAPPVTVPTATPPATGPAVPLTLTAENLSFDKATLTAPAGSTVAMTFVNRDTGMPHNFALYTDATAATKIFAGEVVTGPATVTYTFTVPSSPGKYFFRCDAHPALMTGTFVVT